MLTEQGRPISKLVAIAAGVLIVGIVAGVVVKFSMQPDKKPGTPEQVSQPTKN